MHTDTYTVQGLTCGSCIAEVMELVWILPGVRRVSVAYSKDEASPMLIESTTVVPAEHVSAALESGGFTVSGAGRRRTRHLIGRASVRLA